MTLSPANAYVWRGLPVRVSSSGFVFQPQDIDIKILVLIQIAHGNRDVIDGLDPHFNSALINRSCSIDVLLRSYKSGVIRQSCVRVNAHRRDELFNHLSKLAKRAHIFMRFQERRIGVYPNGVRRRA
jgi:hypothetical protein